MGPKFVLHPNYKVVSLFARLKLDVHPKSPARSRFQKRKLAMKKTYCIFSSLVPPPMHVGEFGSYIKQIAASRALVSLPKYFRCVNWGDELCKMESFLEGVGHLGKGFCPSCFLCKHKSCWERHEDYKPPTMFVFRVSGANCLEDAHAILLAQHFCNS